jgi:two-component system, chemotaxis family, chemotaxis protein CheY
MPAIFGICRYRVGLAGEISVTIVIVDDSPTALVVLKSFAGERGQREVVTFARPSQALEYLLSNVVDAVVVDFNMPEMDGIQLTQRLRESEIHKATPIVMVTGSEDAATRARASVAGANAFLGKPVKMAEFKAVLADILKEGGWPFVDRRQSTDFTAIPDGCDRRVR